MLASILNATVSAAMLLLGSSDDFQAHDIGSNFEPQQRHVLLVKVKCCAPGGVLSILQCKYAAVAAVCLIWDVCRKPAHTQRSTSILSASAAIRDVQVADGADSQHTSLHDDAHGLGQAGSGIPTMLQATQPGAICKYHRWKDTSRGPCLASLLVKQPPWADIGGKRHSKSLEAYV